MAWIELHQSLREHRKMFSCAESLNLSRIEMIGTLVSLWLWALDNAPDGSLAGVSNQTIAYVCGWPEKKAGKLVDALRNSGFLDADDSGTLHIHDWYDYAGKLMDRREKDRKRKNNPHNGCGNPKKVQTSSTGFPSEIQGNSNGNPQEIHGKDVGIPYATVPIPYHNRTNNISAYIPEDICPPPAAQAPAPTVLEGKAFTQFWEDYPKKLDRDNAWAAWKALNPDADTVRSIRDGLGAWKRSGEWLDDGGRFIPSAAKWLTNRRWEYTPPPAREAIPKGATGELGEAELEAIRRMLSSPDESEG